MDSNLQPGEKVTLDNGVTIGVPSLDEQAETEKLTKKYHESDGACPDCGCKEWADGPRAGMSVDILCLGCGSEFCYALSLSRVDRPEAELRQIYGDLPCIDRKFGHDSLPTDLG